MTFSDRPLPQELDSQLVPRTYIVSNYLTAADVALYGALHPVIVCLIDANKIIIFRSDQHLRQSQLQSAQYYAYPALTRYFDHIQTTPSVRKCAESLAPAFSLVLFDLDNAPKPERKAEAPKKKEKKTDNPADTSVTAAKDKEKTAAGAVEGKTDGKTPKEKKEKKKDLGADGKKADASKKVAPSAEDAGEPVPSMIDLRVGHIIDGKSHCLTFCLDIYPLLQSKNIQTQMASILRYDSSQWAKLMLTLDV
jgi:aminoacyl tRNA synthase complex-interacting multifunctional protein 1